MGKLLKVARTIADLDGSKVVLSNHILEALSYRINELGLGDEHI
jgi:predicted ATPase with chaperone activity